MRRRLLAITAILALLTLVHDFDHVRQGRSLPGELYFVAVAAFVSIAATALAVARYPRWARVVAVGLGLATAVGVGAIHVAPQWSALTDSYGAAHADLLSWMIISAMMLAGLALAVTAACSDH